MDDNINNNPEPQAKPAPKRGRGRPVKAPAATIEISEVRELITSEVTQLEARLVSQIQNIVKTFQEMTTTATTAQVIAKPEGEAELDRVDVTIDSIKKDPNRHYQKFGHHPKSWQDDLPDPVQVALDSGWKLEKKFSTFSIMSITMEEYKRRQQAGYDASNEVRRARSEAPNTKALQLSQSIEGQTETFVFDTDQLKAAAAEGGSPASMARLRQQQFDEMYPDASIVAANSR